MALFELIIALLFVGAVFALWADRICAPYPALLALVGAVVALIPGTPTVNLDPNLGLALFVAPTLLDAAYAASPRDLRRHVRPVLSLAVALVIVTIIAVAWALKQVIPEVGWAAAITLGAIVAPPDASAATAVLKKLRPPHRLLVILEGESLFNDASSLLIYRVAVGAALTGAFSGWSVIPTLLLTCGGGAFIGWIFARVYILFSSRVTDVPINVLLQFIAAFAIWLLAERLGLSAIITVVAYAMTLARRLAGRVNARLRLASSTVWEVAVIVLNVLAFVLIGLQLRGVVERVEGDGWKTHAIAAVVVCATVIIVRIVWIMTYANIARRIGLRRGWEQQDLPTFESGVLASWCGMRGIVTLATALALPAGATPFPYRDIIVFCAFCVVLTTLVFQGLTLRPLMSKLHFTRDDTLERELMMAREATARAALEAVKAEGAHARAAESLRTEYEARLQRHAVGRPPDDLDEALAGLQRQAVAAQRNALCQLRARKMVGDAAYHQLEEELDLLELTAEVRARPTAGFS